MNRKLIVTGLTCVLLLISGICYSCAYSQKQPVLISSMSETEKDGAAAQEEQEDFPDSKEQSENGTIEEAENQATAESETEEASDIYVHICGAVENPGVYQVEERSRIVDLIKVAGGLKQDAAADYINQAVQVTDGQRIYVPTLEEVKEQSPMEVQDIAGVVSPNSESSALVNINTAGAEELMSLPGIGQAKADSIIAYRSAHGEFKNIEALMNIPGIKEGLFNQIVSMIIAD